MSLATGGTDVGRDGVGPDGAGADGRGDGVARGSSGDAVGRVVLDASDRFEPRHLGPDAGEVAEMLQAVGSASVSSLMDEVVPADIRFGRALDLGWASAGLAESEAVARLKELSSKNQVFRSCLGMGYVQTILPSVILRNVLENPGWYTQYTPYQAEISQGRLEALLNFQTMIADLTGLPLANASLLDEATAAGEAMSMCLSIASGKPARFYAAEDCHPQTLEVLATRAKGLGVELVVGPADEFDPADGEGFAGVLLQYPTTDGRIEHYGAVASAAKASGTVVVAAADPLALTLLAPPGEWGADICVGSAQRFGVPMGFGGPHAGFLSTHEKHVRKLPGRLVGVSRDAEGRHALRLTIQTREQHIKRDRATSNICTAQVLLAVIAGFYGVYHGPEGLRRIATRVRLYTETLRAGLAELGHGAGQGAGHAPAFDTLRVRVSDRDTDTVLNRARSRRINLRDFGDGSVGVTLDEATDRALLRDLLFAFGGTGAEDVDAIAEGARLDLGDDLERTSGYMTHPVFNAHRSETQMLRYLHALQERDLSLVHSMIPLGSCTMKLNSTSEMLPVTWEAFGGLHPFAPREQWSGYAELFGDLERWLAEITGFKTVSLQPNAGSQGEYAGLLAIRAYHESRGEGHRDVCLIPESAHGTNPASAIVAGMRVVGVKCYAAPGDGEVAGGTDIDLDDLRAKAEEHKDSLAALMVTYPSTRGVFGENIREICSLVHERGGQVYLDGANLNAQVGLARPGDYGADVCHLNLHKTFCIPHGGGGPGMGPIGVAEHLAPFLPGHSVVRPESVTGGGFDAVSAVSAAPYGSASILTISWMYIAMMGSRGLLEASELSVLNANYMAHRLEGHYGVLFKGPTGRVAHEFIVDCRPFKKIGIEIDDVAKRLIDYGFHAPTMSWPIVGTLMIEPTESESKDELDRFCEAMIAIRAEIAKIESGEWTRDSNPLKHAPHTAAVVAGDSWDRPYPRSLGAYPAPWLQPESGVGSETRKFWPAVSRVDNPYGDRNLVCSCPPVSELAEG
ncbi:MAG: aminomethyl-transferring glycine dehydrogenase [Planctomycetota bacterium]